MTAWGEVMLTLIAAAELARAIQAYRQGPCRTIRMSVVDVPVPNSGPQPDPAASPDDEGDARSDANFFPLRDIDVPFSWALLLLLAASSTFAA